MKIAIIGAGAVGSMLAYIWHEAGLDVTLIAKGHQAACIQEKGLLVVEDGKSKSIHIPCVCQLDFQPDLAVFAVKTQDVVYAYRDHVDHLPFDTPVLMVQNGVQAENMLSTHIDPEKIFSGIMLFWTEMRQAHELFIYQSGPVVIGRSFYANNPLLLQMKEAFHQPRLDVLCCEEIMAAKWLKLLVNMANVPSALVNMSLTDAYAFDEVCQLNYRLTTEALGVLDKAGVELESVAYIKKDKFLAPYKMGESEAIPQIKERFVGRSPQLLGSMLQSLRAKKESEIDFITGEIVQLARGVESKAPVNKAVTNAVHDIEQGKAFLDLNDLPKRFNSALI